MLEATLSPINKYSDGAPCVRHLLALGCPSTVACAVSSIVIDSLKGSAWWSRSHVTVEVIKAGPGFAEPYPAINVMLNAHFVFPAAPPPHLAP